MCGGRLPCLFCVALSALIAVLWPMQESSKEVERETKFEIDGAHHFQRLLAVLGPRLQRVVQWNLYLDTADWALRRNGAVLRGRVRSDGLCVVTYKELREKGSDGSMLATEIEAECHGSLIRAMAEGGMSRQLVRASLPEAMVRRLPAQELLLKSWAKTMRHMVAEGAFLICADETVFPGGHRDFELEVEGPDTRQAFELALRLLEEASLAPVPQTRTKNQRAMQWGVKEPGPPPLPHWLNDRLHG